MSLSYPESKEEGKEEEKEEAKDGGREKKCRGARPDEPGKENVELKNCIALVVI